MPFVTRWVKKICLKTPGKWSLRFAFGRKVEVWHPWIQNSNNAPVEYFVFSRKIPLQGSVTDARLIYEFENSRGKTSYLSLSLVWIFINHINLSLLDLDFIFVDYLVQNECLYLDLGFFDHNVLQVMLEFEQNPPYSDLQSLSKSRGWLYLIHFCNIGEILQL